MKLFKDIKNTVFAYELDGSQDDLIGDKTPITQEEADAIIFAIDTEQQAIIKAQVSAKQSAKFKLAALGLTEDEIKALIGQ
jgi:hypothetical protein